MQRDVYYNLLEGARIIRPFLPALLGQQKDAMLTLTDGGLVNVSILYLVTTVDQALAQALELANKGQRVDTLLVTVLSSHESTREWIRRYLEDNLESPYDYIPTPGKPPRSPKTIVCTCSGGDYKFYPRTKGQPIPSCPNHGPLTCA